jgi:hypothetical protein
MRGARTSHIRVGLDGIFLAHLGVSPAPILEEAGDEHRSKVGHLVRGGLDDDNLCVPERVVIGIHQEIMVANLMQQQCQVSTRAWMISRSK